MFKNLLLSLILSTFLSLPAVALTTDDKSVDLLKVYGAVVSAGAGSSQWQELWKNTRAKGAFTSDGAQPRFTISYRNLPDMVSATIAAADDVAAKEATRVLFRRSFSPLSTGLIDKHPVNSVCALVDFRGVAEGQLPSNINSVSGVRLLMAQPCK